MSSISDKKSKNSNKSDLKVIFIKKNQKKILNITNIILLVLLSIFICLITTTKIFIDNDVFFKDMNIEYAFRDYNYYKIKYIFKEDNKN